MIGRSCFGQDGGSTAAARCTLGFALAPQAAHAHQHKTKRPWINHNRQHTLSYSVAVDVLLFFLAGGCGRDMAGRGAGALLGSSVGPSRGSEVFHSIAGDNELELRAPSLSESESESYCCSARSGEDCASMPLFPEAYLGPQDG